MSLTIKMRNALIAATLSVSLPAFAEDIDLYQGGAEVTGNRPNVLIILDNSANWARSDQGWPNGLKQGESELNALINSIAAQTDEIRVGLMMFTDADPNGGYMRFGIRTMSAGNRTAITTMLAGIKPNFQAPTEKTASAKTNYSNVMYEAYRYFGSMDRYAANDAKRDYVGNGSYNVSPYTAGSVRPGNALLSAANDRYQTPLSTDAPCSKNYIIFIGNGFPSQDTTPTALSDPNLVFSGDTTNANYFDTTQIATSASATSANYADEWARFLKEKGTPTVCTNDTPAICANSRVMTYTIDVYKDHQDTDQTALLKSMATVGGGSYCSATSEEAIQACLNNIFNETQAVDSVFTSASLPVSVNTQGTYLNQIYMGVFRPDVGGRPRWLGNLKEYRFGLTTDASGNDTIYLADSTNTNGVATPAVNNVTGFIKPSAKSYWTSSTSPNPGFWSFKPSGLGGQYDSPDGDLVEKGAAAQKLRTLGHASRTVYTCPAAGCTANATPNAFSTANAALVSSLTGTSANISTLTRTGTTVTVTTATDLGLASPTDTITISGASVAAYNATWSVTKIDATHFSFTISETPLTPATGTITVAAGSSVSQNVTAANMTYSNGTVSVNLPAHGFVSGQTVTIAGADVSASMSTASNKCSSWPATTACEYNGSFSITVVDSNNFTYTPPTTNFGNIQTTATVLSPPDIISTPGQSVITCSNNSGSDGTVNNTSITRVAGTGSRLVKVALASLPTSCVTPLTRVGNGNNGRILTIKLIGTGTAMDSVAQTITGVGASCGNTASSTTDNIVCFNVTVTSNQEVTGTTTIAPASPATTAGSITAVGIPTRVVSSLTRADGNGSNVATVTITTPSAHNFSDTTIIVAGANQTEYNGTKTAGANSLSYPTPTTITYTVVTGPTTPSTGGSVGLGSSVNPNTLINWIRGMDNKEDENRNESLTDTRASIHGDVLHSRPVVVNYGSAHGLVAFYGSNDGILRAVKAGDASTDGVEKWAFVAPEHYSTLGRLYNNSPVIKFPTTSLHITPTPTKRDYFFDGNIGVYQSADLATTHIFVTMRRGGRVIYAFDVSDPDSPRFMWKKSYADNGFSELGSTWSEPKVVILKRTSGVACTLANASTYTRALIFGAGYDPTEEDKANQGSTGVVRTPTMGRGVFVINEATGALIKLLQPADNKKYSFPSDVTLLDTDNDGCVDRLYAVDTGANIHRFDIGDPDSTNWKRYKIAQLGDVGNDGGSDDRKFLYPADSVLGYLNGTQTAFVMIGSGNRELPRDENVTNMFFMVKDTVQQGADPADVTTIRLGDLTSITVFDASTTTIDATDADFKGWYITMETGEKVVNTPITVAGVTYFGTNTPRAASSSCTPNLGTARGYQINYLTGTAAAGDRNGDGVVDASDLYTNFAGGGLPPSPVSGVVKIGEKFVRFVIGGGCNNNGAFIDGCKVQANPASNRTRAYWYFKKDD